MATKHILDWRRYGEGPWWATIWDCENERPVADVHEARHLLGYMPKAKHIVIVEGTDNGFFCVLPWKVARGLKQKGYIEIHTPDRRFSFDIEMP